MPHIKVKTPTGTQNFCYTISTPTFLSAESIDKTIPTILCLNPEYIGQQVYHPLFADRKLRKFNLIAVDSRLHGNTSGKVPKDFNPVHGGEDIALFMKALKVPTYHLVGISMGCLSALQAALTCPDKVLSLFLISPLPMEEPEDVAAGRREICEYWTEGFKNTADPSAALDAVHGALQLAFNNDKTLFINTLVEIAYPQAAENWSAKHLDEYKAVTVGFFENRNIPQESLVKIKCPIMLCHCGKDATYTIEHITELQATLSQAGIEVSIVEVPNACKYGVVTHAHKIMALLDSFLDKVEPLATVLTTPDHVISPWDEQLRLLGWTDEDSSDGE